LDDSPPQPGEGKELSPQGTVTSNNSGSGNSQGNTLSAPNSPAKKVEKEDQKEEKEQKSRFSRFNITPVAETKSANTSSEISHCSSPNKPDTTPTCGDPPSLLAPSDPPGTKVTLDQTMETVRKIE